ncbi:MAG: alkaline phosphatase family protein [Acidobacteria bacterium]|nr:alkaline phosphatase family protein [Acidobacteriota bacterium]
MRLLRPALITALLLLAACTRNSHPARRVIVLGVDAMDPVFVETHFNQLPNLQRLARQGQFKRLGTTTPPESPVAWSTFATGLDPAQHGIFDFVHRAPSTLQPFSALGATHEPRFTLPAGPWILPLSKGGVESFRHGQTSWDILSNAAVPVALMRMPVNYPPGKLHGHALAGMGVPDLLGTFGTFTLYSDSPFESSRAVSGGRIVQVQVTSGRVEIPITGPANSLRKDQRPSSIPLIVDVDAVHPVARFRVAGQQFVLQEGEWSSWIRAEFPLLPGLASAHGMFRFHVNQLHPGFRLYLSAINVDPFAPDLPISWPESYSAELARAVGPYSTQGIREDTAALREGALTLPEYRAQSRHVFEEDLAVLRQSLAAYRDGLLFFYFSSIDQDSHMFFGKHDGELLETYRAVDLAIGEVMASGKYDDLIVMSDHGFAPFDRGVNLNTWLLEQGYLVLDDPRNTGPDELFAHVDWSRTRAYALGLNCLYLNLAGREKHGIVQPADAATLLEEIRGKLLATRDPANGKPPVTAVSRPTSRPERFTPDLIIGFARTYRTSWNGALGAVAAAIYSDNTDAWVADHCMDAREVPGVLISTRATAVANPELKDLTVTLLHLFGVKAPPPMTGRNLY